MGFIADTFHLEPKKPHHGRIKDWSFVGVVGEPGYRVMGWFIDHPVLGKHGGQSVTSNVVAWDSVTGEIETLNSRYTLVKHDEDKGASAGTAWGLLSP